jgi:acyl-CoA thioester hydrolase
VRFAETDAQGIANNAEYLVWFEVARVAYLARFRGGYSSLREDGVEALTLETHARYLRPAYFDDRLLIHTRCVDLRGARFRFEYVVERNGERIADGSTAHACVDAGSFRPTRVPDWLRDEIRQAEAAGAAAKAEAAEAAEALPAEEEAAAGAAAFPSGAAEAEAASGGPSSRSG